MKILKKNDGMQKWSIKVVCDGHGWDQHGKIPCYSKLELNSKDVYFRKHTDISGWTDTYYGFTCPVCECFTELSLNELPTSIKAHAKDYKN